MEDLNWGHLADGDDEVVNRLRASKQWFSIYTEYTEDRLGASGECQSLAGKNKVIQ